MAELSLSEVSVALGDPPTPVLSSITTRFRPGAITLVLGANGSGKSVLLRAVLGLVPADGAVKLDGEILSRRRDAFYRRTGVTFQNPDLQIFGETVREDVQLGFRQRRGTDASEEELHALLHRNGLSGLADRTPWELSGGQRRRLAIAGAVAGDPEVLLLDEPFLELDFPSVRDLIATIAAARDRGATVVVTSHETRDIWPLVDTVVVLDGGRVVYDGPPRRAHHAVNEAHGLRPLNQVRDSR